MAVRSSSQDEITLPRRHTSAMSGRLSVEALVLGQLVAVLVPQDVEALGIGLHQAVFDAVVDHLDEMAGAGRAGMDIALLGARIAALAARRARDVAEPGRQRVEDRIEPVDRLLVAADHHAVAALEPPDAARGADVDIVDALLAQRLGAADVVLVEGVAAVDDDVARSSRPASVVDRLLGDRRRPAASPRPRAALSSCLDQVLEAADAGRRLPRPVSSTASASRS